MKNSEYWAKRARELEEAQNGQNERYISGELERIYGKAIRETEKDIARWFARFAKNNKVTMAQARKLLTSDELKELKWTVEEYIEYGQKNGVSGEWIKQLENASARYHISRLDALKLQMREHVEELTASEARGVKDLIQNHYEDSFYKTAYEVQKFTRIGTTLEKLDKDGIERALSKPWAPDGRDFSSRIWGEYRPQLVNELHKTLSQAIIMGDNPKVIADGFVKYVSDASAKTYKQKLSRAENLVMTETAYFRAEGQRKSYKELGVEEFENCATLDSRTSEICRDMDGTHFPVSEMQPGLNCPPFHPRCRTATCPYFNDEFTADEERAARSEDGEYYTVPADMTYREWRDSMTDSKRQELDFRTKAARNRSADKEQHERYKKVLGTKNVPKSLDEFQDLKYNDSEGWADLKYYYRNIGDRPIEYVKIDRDLEKAGVTGKGKAYPVETVNVKGWRPHAETRLRERGISKEQALKYMNTAIVMMKKYPEPNTQLNFYSEDGVIGILQKNNKVCTTLSKDDFRNDTKRIIEVSNKWLRS